MKDLSDILNGAYRQWVDFTDDRKDCNLKDYNNFILEIAEQIGDKKDEA